jgi:DNA-binding SARP family transcriptional activator
MDPSFAFYQEALMVAPEGISLAFLLERGIDCIRQGCYVEGASFIALARERLTADQLHFAIVLDAFLQSHASYLEAQQALHLATKRFAEADVGKEAQLLAIEKLLLTLGENANTVVQRHAAAQHSTITEAHQSQLLRQPPRLISDPVDPNRSIDPDGNTLPNLYITCFGHFEVRRFDQPIMLCHRRKGQAILRYLVAQPGYRASIDKLMDVLWAQDPPEVARRKLQIAVSALRCSLNNGYICGPGEGHILCKDGIYQLNSSVTIRTDVDEFLSLWKAGRQASGSESATLYERACSLCSGPFLVEDTYADWSSIRREQLKQVYLTMCRILTEYDLEVRYYEDAVKWTSAILREDPCDEAAHRQLIRIYMIQSLRSEALQQYYRCERILHKELGLPPMPETTNLLQAILNSAD